MAERVNPFTSHLHERLVPHATKEVIVGENDTYFLGIETGRKGLHTSLNYVSKIGNEARERRSHLNQYCEVYIETHQRTFRFVVQDNRWKVASSNSPDLFETFQYVSDFEVGKGLTIEYDTGSVHTGNITHITVVDKGQQVNSTQHPLSEVIQHFKHSQETLPPNIRRLIRKGDRELGTGIIVNIGEVIKELHRIDNEDRIQHNGHRTLNHVGRTRMVFDSGLDRTKKPEETETSYVAAYEHNETEEGAHMHSSSNHLLILEGEFVICVYDKKRKKWGPVEVYGPGNEIVIAPFTPHLIAPAPARDDDDKQKLRIIKITASPSVRIEPGAWYNLPLPENIDPPEVYRDNAA